MRRNDLLLSRRGLLGGGAAAIAVLALKPSVARAGSRVILAGHRSFVDAAVFSPDGESIVTASWDGTARHGSGTRARVGWCPSLPDTPGASTAPASAPTGSGS